MSSLLPRLTFQIVTAVVQYPIGQVHASQQFATNNIKLLFYVNSDYGSTFSVAARKLQKIFKATCCQRVVIWGGHIAEAPSRKG